MTQEMARRVADALVASRNGDGGWGTRPGLTSATEPTALAALALLGGPEAAHVASASGALGWLLARQNPDGGWPAVPAVEASGWPSSLAVLALARTSPGDESQRRAALRGGLWLLGQRGRRLPWLRRLISRLRPEAVPKPAVELDADLVGWPWTFGSFSWVEPTSYALLALKTLRGRIGFRPGEGRIREGERMILDRACVGGGWNYGNYRVLGEDLWPYPDTTALALLALHGSESARVDEGLEALGRMMETVDSPLALSLAIGCLRRYRRDASELEVRLVRQLESGEPSRETRTLAFTAVALAGREQPFAFEADA